MKHVYGTGRTAAIANSCAENPFVREFPSLFVLSRGYEWTTHIVYAIRAMHGVV